jgi:hypothetical protein
MSNDFVIGASPIPETDTCKLSFHQYTIYDSTAWTESGYVYYDAVTKQFTVQTAPPQKNTGIFKAQKKDTLN